MATERPSMSEIALAPAREAVFAYAERYFQAWNARDARAVVAQFAPGGTYKDPASGGPLSGPAIGAYADGLFAAFPDLAFDLVSAILVGDGTLAAEWRMRGTNTAPLAGNPPTGRTVSLPGADFITFDGDQIRS